MEDNPSYNQGDLQLPVENITWNDCQTFISKLNQLTGMNFRLPTDAEWEYAAYGCVADSLHTMYAGSDVIDEVGWYGKNSDNQTHPVASKLPNELGLYDMTGNVWEWCQDWFSNYSTEAQFDPTGPDYGTDKIFRGGNFYNDSRFCRIYYRGFDYPTVKGKKTGLRIAL